MTDGWLLSAAAACILGAGMLFLNLYQAHAGKRRGERRAYSTALHATDDELNGMTLDHLLDLRARLTGFADHEKDLLDSSIAAAERLDEVIVAKDTARRLTGVRA